LHYTSLLLNQLLIRKVLGPNELEERVTEEIGVVTVVEPEGNFV